MHLKEVYRNTAAAVDTLLREKMTALQIPGITVSLLYGGDTVYQTAMGIRDREAHPMDSGTLFESASLTKTLFGTLVLRLAQEGRLDIDRPIMDTLQDTPWSDDPRFVRITPRQCLCHACGLPNWEAKPMHMLFDPGQQYSYSGEGYFLTQRLVEQITEKDLNELLMEYFLRPLHMDIASATWTPEIGRRFSLGFGVDGKVVKIRDKRRTTGNAPEPCAAWSLYGNSFEMIRFLQYMIRDHGGLEERWFTELRRPQIAAGTGISWGLGWGLCSADPTVLWHWGDNDGFKSISLLDWDSGDGISIYTNSDNGFAFWAQVCAELTDAVFMDELVEFVRHAEE